MWGRYAGLAVGLLLMVSMQGCESTELEQRSFPLALGIDIEETEEGKEPVLKVSYDFPDLKQISEKSKTSDTPMGLSIQGSDMYHVEKSYENNTNRILDYNHLKAVVLGTDMFQNMGKLRGILNTWEQKQKIARSTSLFLAEPGAAQLLSLTKETEGSVGKYLEEMIESQGDFRQEKIATAGDLMNQWHNQNELLLVPVLTDQAGRPVISGYGIISDFKYLGTVSVEEAMEIYLTQNLMKEFILEQENQVMEITDLVVNKEVTEEEERPVVHVNVKGKARVYQGKARTDQEQYLLEQQAEELLEFRLSQTAASMKETYGIDITNSYVGLGGYSRKLYRRYQNRPDTYGKEVQPVFRADISMLNWD